MSSIPAVQQPLNASEYKRDTVVVQIMMNKAHDFSNDDE